MFDITSAGIEIFIIAIILAIASNLVTKFTVGKEALANKEKTKKLQEELKAAMKRNDLKRAKEIQKEMMASMGSSMSVMLKPMLITFIPFILVFIWMAGNYGNIGGVEYIISINNISGATATLEDPFTFNESSKLTGVLKAGESKNFKLIVMLNKFETYNTTVNINLNAKCIDSDCRYNSSAEAHLTTGEELKKPFKEEKDIVDISPKFQSKKSDSGVERFEFTVKNYRSDAVIKLFGISLSWFWWYLIAMLIVSMIAGKLLKTM